MKVILNDIKRNGIKGDSGNEIYQGNEKYCK